MEPYVDTKFGGLVVKETADWIVSVHPMIFNDRVCFSYRETYPHYDGGWCYDRGPAALLAALAWNPDEQERPVGFEKEAIARRSRSRW